MENFETNDTIPEGNTSNANNKIIIIMGVIVISLLLLGSFYIGTKYNPMTKSVQNQIVSDSTEITPNQYEENKSIDRNVPNINQPTVLKNLFNTFSILNVSSGVVSREDITIYWQVSEDVKSLFPTDETYIVFELVNEDTGKRVASIGDGVLLNKNTYTDKITELIKDNRINNESHYYIKASLDVQPSNFSCDQNMPGECVPVYNMSDSSLINAAEQYLYESTTFTFDNTLWQTVNKKSSVVISGPTEITLGEKAIWTGIVANDDNDHVEINCRVSRWQTGPDKFGNAFTYSDWGENIFKGTASSNGSFEIMWTASETTEGNKYFEIDCIPWEEKGTFAGDGDSIRLEVK